MAIHELFAVNATTISHPMEAVSKENNIPPPHGACDGHDHATGEIEPAVTSPDPSGIASTAVLSPGPPFPLNNRASHANQLHAKWQDAMDTNIVKLVPVQENLLLKK